MGKEKAGRDRVEKAGLGEVGKEKAGRDRVVKDTKGQGWTWLDFISSAWAVSTTSGSRS